MPQSTLKYPTIGESVEVVDVTTERGTFLVVTRTGTSYIVVANGLRSGRVEVISDGTRVTHVREGIVGETEHDVFDQEIRVGRPLVIGWLTRQERIVHSSPVKEIWPVEDGLLGELSCPVCRGFKELGEDCQRNHS